MKSESENFEAWAELAAGDEARQFIPAVAVAEFVGFDVHRVIRAAVALKRENPAIGQSVMWLRGVPWFSMPLVAAIEAKLKADIITNLQAKVDAMNAADRAARQ